MDFDKARNDYDGVSVLVSIVEPGDDSQGVALRVTSFLLVQVRLKAFDGVDCFVGKTGCGVFENGYVPRLSFCLLPSPRVVQEDWKSGISLVLLRPHRDENMVKGGPHVMDRIADDNRQHLVKRLGYFKKVAPVVLFGLCPCNKLRPVDLLAIVRPEVVIDLFEMAIRPLELEPPGLRHGLPLEEDAQETEGEPSRGTDDIHPEEVACPDAQT